MIRHEIAQKATQSTKWCISRLEPSFEEKYRQLQSKQQFLYTKGRQIISQVEILQYYYIVKTTLSVTYSTELQAVREWPDGTTDTHQALLRATLELNTRQRSGVPQVIVIMTDGQSNYLDGTMTAVAIAEANNITIVSVGKCGFFFLRRFLFCLTRSRFSEQSL